MAGIRGKSAKSKARRDCLVFDTEASDRSDIHPAVGETGDTGAAEIPLIPYSQLTVSQRSRAVGKGIAGTHVDSFSLALTSNNTSCRGFLPGRDTEETDRS